MLSAKGEVFDKVLGLELGADDYIMKPFDSKEMVARVRAVLRRYQPVRQEAPVEDRGKCVEYPGIVINLTNYSVLLDGKMWTCRQRSWNFSTFLPPPPTRSSQGSSSWTDLGLRVHRRHTDCGRTHQTSPGEDQGSSLLVSCHRVGHRL